MSWDLVVRGGRVVDGTGLPPFTADVAVKDGLVEIEFRHLRDNPVLNALEILRLPR